MSLRQCARERASSVLLFDASCKYRFQTEPREHVYWRSLDALGNSYPTDPISLASSEILSLQRSGIRKNIWLSGLSPYTYTLIHTRWRWPWKWLLVEFKRDCARPITMNTGEPTRVGRYRNSREGRSSRWEMVLMRWRGPPSVPSLPRPCCHTTIYPRTHRTNPPTDQHGPDRLVAELSR